MITLDNSLPGALQSPDTSGTTRPVAVTLDALVQWLSVVSPDEADEQAMASIFAESLKSMLPHGVFFDLQDFLVLASMELSCKELPEQDVEECIRTIRAKAPSLDPSKAEDREKLAHEISRFFAGPGQKYQKDLAAAKAERLALQGELQAQRAAQQATEEQRQREAERFKQQLAGEVEARQTIESQLRGELERRDAEVKQLKDDKEKEHIRRSAHRRLALCAVLLIVLLACVTYVASAWGEGRIGTKDWSTPRRHLRPRLQSGSQLRSSSSAADNDLRYSPGRFVDSCTSMGQAIRSFSSFPTTEAGSGVLSSENSGDFRYGRRLKSWPGTKDKTRPFTSQHLKRCDAPDP